MKTIESITLYAGSNEERLPGFSPAFPYIATRPELEQYPGRSVPWHWHKAVELFYMESGVLEYRTPQGATLFPAGSGGLVNSNVLHMTRLPSETVRTVQLLHIFDPALIAGEPGSRIEQKYVLPLTAAPHIEIVALSPDDPAQDAILRRIRDAFRIPENSPGYELRLREALSAIWLALFELTAPLLGGQPARNQTSEKLKLMLTYIYEHYAEKLSVAQLAAAGFSSERECFRAFHDCLHTTPNEYLKNYRIQAACQMLVNTRAPLSVICRDCGLGSSSYFGKVFRECVGCTPSEYRSKWQDRDSKGR